MVWVVAAAVPVLNAQQASPGQTTAATPQQSAKPKANRNKPFPQPNVGPSQPTTAKKNPGRDKKGTGNHPGGNEKTTDDNAGNGKATDNNGAPGKVTNDNRDSYADAMRRYRHERHDQDWWKRNYVVIVLVGGGYYYRDSGYWFPAWGFDPNYESYDYDGPIYTYGNLLPDQVIVNVQHALKELGYYQGDVTGSLGPGTRRALAAYQADSGLEATGVVDEPTVRALGLI